MAAAHKIAPRLLNCEQAAAYIGCSVHTLNNSRSSGMLNGIAPPPYCKLGASVRYDIRNLDDWIDQLARHQSNAAYLENQEP